MGIQVAVRRNNSQDAAGVKKLVVEEDSETGFQAVKFQADSALIRELGERLVGQPHIALAELIKNAYDADATICSVILNPDTLIVSDNGHGMTETEFLKLWMTIGTRHKQEKGVSRGFGRNVTGSKGVGRLSAQFLAHRLQIVTAPIHPNSQQLLAKVNWDEAIEAGKLTEAEALYRLEPRTMTFAGNSEHGTRVLMSGLKQAWTEDLIRDLGRQLWMIQSPLSGYGRLTTATTDPKAFRVELTSWKGDLADAFAKQMTAALQNYDAIISGELIRSEATSKAHIKVVFNGGSTFSESFEVDPLIENARWNIRVFKLQGRQAAAADPAMPALGNSAPCAARRMHALRPNRRDPEGRRHQVLWPACRVERCRAAIARPDLHQSLRPARRGWMLARLEGLLVVAAGIDYNRN
jgi:Histidine kinase-, DNA gyrase B-, and HSP90-like ATPase